jgi:hypothetical protein
MLWISSEVYTAMRKINPVPVSVMTIHCFTSGFPTFQKNLPPALLRLRDEAVGSRSFHNTGNKIQNYSAITEDRNFS